MATLIINADVEDEMWTGDEMKVVERCDSLLRNRGMQMILICEPCLYGGRDPKVVGDNARASNAFHLTCACKRRSYLPPVA